MNETPVENAHELVMDTIQNIAGNNKRGPRFHNRKIQAALLKRESALTVPSLRWQNPTKKKHKKTTLYLSCVPYTNEHSLAKNLFSDRFTQTTNILSRILMRSSLEQYRDITKSRNERDIPDSFQQHVFLAKNVSSFFNMKCSHHFRWVTFKEQV